MPLLLHYIIVHLNIIPLFSQTILKIFTENTYAINKIKYCACTCTVMPKHIYKAPHAIYVTVTLAIEEI